MRTIKIVLVSVLFAFLFLPTNSLQAAGPPKPKPTTDPGCWPPPCVPIDGGISFLIAAGVGLGVKKLYDTKRK